MSDEVKTEEEPSIEEILDSIRQIISEDEDEEGSEEPAPKEVDVSDEPEAAPKPVPEPEPEAEAEPLDQSAIDDMDFDAPTEEAAPEPVPEPEPEVEAEPLDQSAIDDMDFDTPTEEVAEETPEPEAEVEAEPKPEPEDVLELTELVNAEENDLGVDMVEEVEDEPLDQSAIDDVDFDTPTEEAAPEPAPEPTPEPEVVMEPVAGADDSLFTGNAEEAAISAISNLVRKTAVGSSSITLEDIVRAELKPLLRDWLDKNLPSVIERLVQDELERVSKRVLDE